MLTTTFMSDVVCLSSKSVTIDETKYSQKTGGFKLSAEVWSQAERTQQASNFVARISFHSPDRNKISRSHDSESTTSQDTPSKRPNKSSAPVLYIQV